jgi:D-3-phosphoglycerate dehydrogenase / 2-oxoglutarate reductase
MTEPAKRVFYVKLLAHREEYEKVFAMRPDVRLDRLENESSDEVAAPILAGAHAYQIGSSRDELAPRFHATRDLLRRTQSLLVVSTNGAGYDTVDVPACTDAGVLVVNQSGGNAEAVAEHVLGMLLALTKRIGEVDKVMRRQGTLERASFAGNDAFGKTIGIIGIGNVGRRVAELCRGLFTMRVLAYDPYLSTDEIAARGAEKVELDDLMRRADYVSINCPLTPETRGMVGREQYALMQPHAYFITTARGSIHDEEALAQTLREKRIAGAGVDVWEKEPPPHDHPLMAFDNVIVSPHTAGITRETRAHMGRIAASQLLDALDGKRPPRIVNPEVWPVYARRYEETFGIRPQG